MALACLVRFLSSSKSLLVGRDWARNSGGLVVRGWGLAQAPGRERG